MLRCAAVTKRINDMELYKVSFFSKIKDKRSAGKDAQQHGKPHENGGKKIRTTRQRKRNRNF